MSAPSTEERPVTFAWAKLRLVLWIQSIGMAVALIWHGWQGWVLGRGYPENTFLYYPPIRFSDFYDVVDLCRYSNPYDYVLACYFPFSYFLFKPFNDLPRPEGVLVFLTVCTLGLAFFLAHVLRPLTPDRIARFFLALLLLGLSYPVLHTLDRGNIEIMMVLLVGLAVFFFKRRHFGWGVLCLVPTICLKFYPAALLLLLLRRRQLSWIFVTGLASLIVTLICFWGLSDSITTNWQKWQTNMQTFHYLYIVRDVGLGGSATPWNGCKVLAIMGAFLVDPAFRHANGDDVMRLIEHCYSVYMAVSLVVAALLTLHILFVEREFSRRVILLLILLTLTAPGAGDYRMLYACAALVALVILPGRRPGDLWATGLLAFAFIPKREVLLPFLGRDDVSIAIFLNPPCMMAALSLLVWSGWQLRIPGWGWQRLRGLLNYRGISLVRARPDS